MSNIFEVAEGICYMTSDETRIFTITTTNLVSFTSTTPTAVVYDESVDEDVTDEVMTSGDNHTGTADVITLKAISGLVKGHSYRVEFKFTVSDNTFERYFIVRCTR